MKAHFDGNDFPDGLKSLFESSRVSLSIADYTAPDCPLVGVNDMFCEMSGYEAGDALGRNCRFLQPEGGAGPVRQRMREYLAEDGPGNAKFVVPNVRRDGSQFLNLLYMAKLTRDGKVRLVLGSQFAIDENTGERAGVYDLALQSDLRQLNLLTAEDNWALLGSYDALASSHSIIAQAKLD